MSESISSDAKRDPAWKYSQQVRPNDLISVKCNFCGVVTKGGIFRMKQHLVGGHRNTKSCRKCPQHIKDELSEYMRRKKEEKKQMEMIPDFDEAANDDEDEDEEDIQELNIGNRKRGATTTGSFKASNPSTASVQLKLKKPRQMGPMDMFLTPPNPEDMVNKTKGKQKSIVDSFRSDEQRKVMRKRACVAFSKWMYDAGISFNAVQYKSFKAMVEGFGQFGPGMKPPTYHEVRVTMLKEVVQETHDLMKDHKSDWTKNGCSIMADGWTDKRQRTLINFLVNCPRGSMFVESVDASAYAKTGEKMFELLSKFVERIGEANVVQVVTDSASANVMAGMKQKA